MSAVIEVRALSRHFGPVAAVDGVDLTVAAGEIYGFLGRNGAGKTTLIRCLLGLIPPSGGAVSIMGTTIRAGRTPCALWRHVGYLVEGPGLYPWLTVAEHLGTAADYRGLASSAVSEAITRLDLGRYRDVKAGVLSHGNRQRVGLALALIHRPELLILDEPVNALDPAGVVEIRGLLRELADDGVTVFMSSHNIGEVARLADRVGIIHLGRMVTELPADRLATAEERLVTTFRTPERATRAARALRSRGLQAQPDGDRLTLLDTEALHRPDDIVTWLVEAGAAPMTLRVEHEDLEQLFLRLTRTVAGATRSVAPTGVPA